MLFQMDNTTITVVDSISVIELCPKKSVRKACLYVNISFQFISLD